MQNEIKRELTRLFNDKKSLVSGAIHGAGVLLSVLGTIVLIALAALSGTHVASKVVTLAIYGMCMTLLYLASTNYHIFFLSENIHQILRKIDHMMIYIMIAGTYTPVTMVIIRAYSAPWAVVMLCLVWVCALLGIFLKAFWLEAPRWLSTATYLGMGWLAIIMIHPLLNSPVSSTFLWLLLGGGLFYSAGAILYALKWPRFTNEWFGFHELFHLFILAGSVCHYMMMVVGVVPLNW